VTTKKLDKPKIYILADFDDTLTEPFPEGNNSHLNVWIGRALPNALNNSKELTKYQKVLGKIAYKVLSYKRKRNQNVDPKPKDIRFLGLIARGLQYDKMEVSLNEMPQNKRVVDYLKNMHDKGYSIAVTTMSVTPFTQHWIKSAGIDFIDDCDVKGLELISDETDGIKKVKGLDRSDTYTKIASSFIRGNAQKAKSYFAAKLIDSGNEVAYSIGNSYTDLLSYKSVAYALDKYFGWDRNEAIFYLENHPIHNIHLPVGGTPAFYRNGYLKKPLPAPLHAASLVAPA